MALMSLIASITCLFIDQLNETQPAIAKIIYEFVRTYGVDTLKYEERYGNGVTPYRDANRQTLDWLE
ncbi:MAG: hypothetical protein ACFFE8_04875 [Candidatus Heimdallarchaeota archaeon]